MCDDEYGNIFCDDVDVEMMIERAEVVWTLLLCLWWRQTAQGKDPHRTCSLIIMIVLLVKSYHFLIVTIIVNHLVSLISPGQGKISREMTVTRLLYSAVSWTPLLILMSMVFMLTLMAMLMMFAMLAAMIHLALLTHPAHPWHPRLPRQYLCLHHVTCVEAIFLLVLRAPSLQIRKIRIDLEQS